jgi:5'(3')-deoxyribonucleotidase
MSTVQKVAIEAHSNQVDKLGYAYIGHPRRVARNAASVPLQNESDRNAVIAAAWLHDVIEDSSITAQNLLEMGIPIEVLEAVVLVSDQNKTTPANVSVVQKKALQVTNKIPYYAAIKKNSIARAVKLADLADNCNEQRVRELTENGSPISDGKYPLALATLELSDEEWNWFNKAITSVPDRIIYIDMDNVIVDFATGIHKLSQEQRDKYPNGKGIDEEPGIFSLMDPYFDSVEAVKHLAETNEVYILSTAPWKNPSAWSDKLSWVHKYFGEDLIDRKTGEVNWLHKRLIISHNKHLNKGEYLIDDRLANGAKNFTGLHVHFGEGNESEQRDGTFAGWAQVLAFFDSKGMLAQKA